MTDLHLEEEITITPDDVDESGDQYCHIDDGSGFQTYCGKLGSVEGASCKPYAGEAICQSCGNVNCPVCVKMADLNDRLEDD